MDDNWTKIVIIIPEYVALLDSIPLYILFGYVDGGK